MSITNITITRVISTCRTWSTALEYRSCQTAQAKLRMRLVTCHGVESGDKEGLIFWNLTLKSKYSSTIKCSNSYHTYIQYIHSLLFYGFNWHADLHGIKKSLRRVKMISFMSHTRKVNTMAKCEIYDIDLSSLEVTDLGLHLSSGYKHLLKTSH